LVRQYIDEYHRLYAQRALRRGGAHAPNPHYVVQLKKFKKELNKLRRGVIRNHQRLPAIGQPFHNTLSEYMSAFDQQVQVRSVVQNILNRYTDSARLEMAREIYLNHTEAFEAVANKLADELARPSNGADAAKLGRPVGFFEAAAEAQRLVGGAT